MRHPGPDGRSPRTVAAIIGAIPGVHTAVADAPHFGWLLFGDGSVWPVQRNVVVGRSPNRSAVDGGGSPGGGVSADLIVVRDPAVSRTHLLFDVMRQPPTVRDTASRNGSWLVSESAVRGRISTDVSLASGLEIVFGRSSVRWLEAA